MCKPDMTVISKKDKLITLATFVSLGISFAFMFLVLFWLLFPYKTIEINNEPYPITKEVKQGGVVVFEMDYCKYTKEEVVISRRFIDGIIYIVPDIVTAYNEPGCRASFITENVPDNLPEGEYYMKFYYTYEVNPIRKITVSARTQTFKVTE